MSVLLNVVASVTLAGATLQGEPPMPPPSLPANPATSLEVTLLAGVWLPRLVGEVALGGAPIKVNDEFDLNANETTVNLELAIRKDEIWELWFGGFDFSTAVTGAFRGGGAAFGSLALSSGDPYTARFEMTSVAAELSVTAWRPYADGHSRV